MNVSPSLFILQFTIDKITVHLFWIYFCCLGSRRIRFPVWFLTSCSPTEPSSMALHYLLCITSCLPRKLPEVSHKVPIYLNLLCITLLVMESSCSVPPGTIPIYTTFFTEAPLPHAFHKLPQVTLKVVIYLISALAHTCSWSVPPGTITSFLSRKLLDVSHQVLTYLTFLILQYASRSVPPSVPSAF